MGGHHQRPEDIAAMMEKALFQSRKLDLSNAKHQEPEAGNRGGARLIAGPPLTVLSVLYEAGSTRCRVPALTTPRS